MRVDVMGVRKNEKKKKYLKCLMKGSVRAFERKAGVILRCLQEETGPIEMNRVSRNLADYVE